MGLDDRHWLSSALWCRARRSPRPLDPTTCRLRPRDCQSARPRSSKFEQRLAAGAGGPARRRRASGGFAAQARLHLRGRTCVVDHHARAARDDNGPGSQPTSAPRASIAGARAMTGRDRRRGTRPGPRRRSRPPCAHRRRNRPARYARDPRHARAGWAISATAASAPPITQVRLNRRLEGATSSRRSQWPVQPIIACGLRPDGRSPRQQTPQTGLPSRSTALPACHRGRVGGARRGPPAPACARAANGGDDGRAT